MPVQSAFINWKQEPDEYLVRIMGRERASRLNPLKTFLDNDIVVSFGSDAPCTTPDPIIWLDKAVNNGEQSVSVRDALRMCTFNGCFASFDEKKRGSLEPGKIADMVILSASPYDIAPEKLGELKVEKLILAGREYESKKGNALKGIVSGLFSGSKAF